MSKFRSLFSNQDLPAKKPIQEGERFPYTFGGEIPGTPWIACFISFSCLVCIDLLPQFNALPSQAHNRFVLFSSGTAAENDHLMRYFQFPFPIVGVEPSDYSERYQVYATPFVYRIANGSVQLGTGIQKAEDIMVLFEEAK